MWATIGLMLTLDDPVLLLGAATCALVLTRALTGGVRRLHRQLVQRHFSGPQAHQMLTGTPTMGGLAVVTGSVASYGVLMAVLDVSLAARGTIVIATLIGSAGVGFVDDVARTDPEVKHLLHWANLTFTGLVAAGLALGAHFVVGVPTRLSFVGPFGPDLGLVGFVVMCVALMWTFDYALDYTDGLDGLLGGLSTTSLMAFTVVAASSAAGVAQQDAGSVGLACAVVIGGVVGFLWDNTHPATLFMGQTGSRGVAGALVSVSVLTETALLLFVIGAVFVVELLSVWLQIGYFHLSGGRRLLRLAPLHHHFESLGLHQAMVTVRFWIAGAACAAVGLGLFSVLSL